MKSIESIKVNQVKSESNPCIMIIKQHNLRFVVVNFQSVKNKGHHSKKELMTSNLMSLLDVNHGFHQIMLT